MRRHLNDGEHYCVNCCKVLLWGRAVCGDCMRALGLGIIVALFARWIL
jgi:hypothetical protein